MNLIFALIIGAFNLSPAEVVSPYAGLIAPIPNEASLRDREGRDLGIRVPKNLHIKIVDLVSCDWTSKGEDDHFPKQCEPSQDKAEGVEGLTYNHETLFRVDIPEEWSRCEIDSSLKPKQKVPCCPSEKGCYLFASQISNINLPTAPLKCLNSPKKNVPGQVTIDQIPDLAKKLMKVVERCGEEAKTQCEMSPDSTMAKPSVSLGSLDRHVCRFSGSTTSQHFRTSLWRLFVEAGDASGRSPKELACVILAEGRMKTDVSSGKGDGFAQLQLDTVKEVRSLIDPESPKCNQKYLDVWNGFTTLLRGGAGPLPVAFISQLYTLGPTKNGVNSESMALITSAIYLNSLRDRVIKEQQEACGIHFVEKSDRPNINAIDLTESATQMSWAAYNYGPGHFINKFLKPRCQKNLSFTASKSLASMKKRNERGETKKKSTKSNGQRADAEVGLPHETEDYIQKIKSCMRETPLQYFGNERVSFEDLRDCGCTSEDLNFAQREGQKKDSVLFQKVDVNFCQRSETKWQKRNTEAINQ